jgi:hypothetical protein
VPSFTATASPATEKAALEDGLFLSYSLLSEYQIEEQITPNIIRFVGVQVDWNHRQHFSTEREKLDRIDSSGAFEEMKGQFPLARAVKLDQDDPLPGAEDERAGLDGEGERGAEERGQNVVGDVFRVVGMAVAQLRHHGLEGVEHVEVGAWIEIGGGEGRGGVEDVEAADAGGAGQMFLNLSGDVDDLAFAVGGDGEMGHGGQSTIQGTRGRKPSIIAAGLLACGEPLAERLFLKRLGEIGRDGKFRNAAGSLATTVLSAGISGLQTLVQSGEEIAAQPR